MTTYRALVAERTGENVTVGVHERASSALADGEVRIRVHYSSLNYKDALACAAKGNVVKAYPIVPGIDLAGIVAESRDAHWRVGDEVLVNGYGLGVAWDGGFAEEACVPGDWVVPLPAGLTLREAMAIGTAGFTAALSFEALEQSGLAPGGGPVLVTGASGGVGSFAVALIAGEGHTVVASTGKAEAHDYLRGLGAAEILPREQLCPETIRPLGPQRWAAAVDPVGGRTLAYVLSTVKYGGAVAVSGLTGGAELPTTVLPFILRGVRLIGIDSVECPHALRRRVWGRLAGEWKPRGLLDDIAQDISLEDVPDVLPLLLRGAVQGRVVVRVAASSR